MIGFLLICSSKVKCEEYLKSKEINSCNLINETAVSSIIINNIHQILFFSQIHKVFIYFSFFCGVYLYKLKTIQDIFSSLHSCYSCLNPRKVDLTSINYLTSAMIDHDKEKSDYLNIRAYQHIFNIRKVNTIIVFVNLNSNDIILITPILLLFFFKFPFTSGRPCFIALRI